MTRRPEMAVDAAAPLLAVGYGSDIRGDDAAGRRVVEGLEARDLPGLETRVLHQLAPEVAAACAGRRLVVFVDASVTVAAVRLEQLDPRPVGPVTTHHLHPQSLLGLAAALGWAPVEAVLVSVPAARLGVGTELSPDTAAAVAEAVERVAALCAVAASVNEGGAGATFVHEQPHSRLIGGS